LGTRDVVACYICQCDCDGTPEEKMIRRKSKKRGSARTYELLWQSERTKVNKSLELEYVTEDTEFDKIITEKDNVTSRKNLGLKEGQIIYPGLPRSNLGEIFGLDINKKRLQTHKDKDFALVNDMLSTICVIMNPNEKIELSIDSVFRSRMKVQDLVNMSKIYIYINIYLQ